MIWADLAWPDFVLTSPIGPDWPCPLRLDPDLDLDGHDPVSGQAVVARVLLALVGARWSRPGPRQVSSCPAWQPWSRKLVQAGPCLCPVSGWAQCHGALPFIHNMEALPDGSPVECTSFATLGGGN